MCAQCFRILFNIPSYPAVFFGLRDGMMLITYASVTGIVPIRTIFSSLRLFSSFEALHISLCLIFKFVIVFI
jgi:hypothetical protein